MQALQNTLGYSFKNPALLQEALTHPSFVPGSSRHYERLELLGDAVLNLMVSEYLLDHFRDEKEGDIAKRRAGLVCRESLAMIARQLEIGRVMVVSDSEAHLGGRDNPANLENVLEALMGAMYLDGGLDEVRRIMLPYFVTLSDTMLAPPRDAKTTLQEWAQGQGRALPQYRIVSQEGPPHAPVFLVEVSVENHPAMQASGATKRAAEQEAAKMLIEAIGFAKGT